MFAKFFVQRLSIFENIVFEITFFEFDFENISLSMIAKIILSRIVFETRKLSQSSMLNDFDNFIYKDVLDKNFIENTLSNLFEISLITSLRKQFF